MTVPTLEVITEKLIKHLGLERVSSGQPIETQNFEQLGIDSLEVVDLSLFLESEFGVLVNPDVFPLTASIMELSEYIQKSIEERS